MTGSTERSDPNCVLTDLGPAVIDRDGTERPPMSADQITAPVTDQANPPDAS